MPRSDHLTRFRPTHSEPLAERPISIRLTVEADAYVRSLPAPSEWLRQVIDEAVKQEQLRNRR